VAGLVGGLLSQSLKLVGNLPEYSSEYRKSCQRPPRYCCMLASWGWWPIHGEPLAFPPKCRKNELAGIEMEPGHSH
jgi:hypothetical protein